MGALLPVLKVFERHGLNVQEFFNAALTDRDACVANFVVQGNSIKNIEDFIRDDIMKGHESIMDVTF